MKVYVLYDEQVRVKRARATIQTAWTDDFTDIRRRYLTQPLKQHERQKQAERQQAMEQLQAKVQATERAVAAGPKRQKTGAETTGIKSTAWDRLSHIDGAKKEHLYVDKRRVCIGFCSKGGCDWKNCKFSHHCLKCGKKGHNTHECK